MRHILSDFQRSSYAKPSSKLIRSSLNSMRYLLHLLTVAILSGCATKPQTTRDDSGFPVYGNWCGPNSPGPGRNPAPIDDVDAACMRHDICYANKGYLSCGCDSILVSELTQLHWSKWNGRNSVATSEYKKFEMPIVTTIRAYFAGSPCAGIPNVPVKIITGGDTALRTAILGIDFVYYLVRLPFLLAGKAVCAITSGGSLACYQIDTQIKSGSGTGNIIIK